MRRARRGGAAYRAAVLVTLGILFWIVFYSVMVRLLRHFATVDPDLGRILSAKLMALVFLLWLSFLAFSALITAVSQCFLSRDLPMWAAAPIPLRRLFRVKFVEVASLSSWTAVFLAIPVWVAYGQVFDAGATYYLALALAASCCVAITTSVGVTLAVALVNLFPARKARDLLSLVALVFLVVVVILLRALRPEQFVRPEDFGTWAEYLVSLSNPTLPWLPSYWASRILSEILGLHQQVHWEVVRWYGLLLVSGALLSSAFAAGVFREMFRTGYSKSQEARQVTWTRNDWWQRAARATAWPFPDRIRALIVKDVSTFFRDPSQWSQFFLLLTVVAVYLYNFRVLPLDSTGGTGYFLRNMMAFLNVALVGLVVTALAARFVLPSVSLEGNSLWLLRVSPLTVRELLWAKFWGGLIPLLILAEALVLLTNELLDTTQLLSVLSLVAVLFLSVAIVGMAVGLGAIHPRFDAPDSAQVTSGYAGFLFMVLSALLVLVSVIVLAWPVYTSFRAAWLGAGVGAGEWGGLVIGLMAVGGLCGVAVVTAMRSGMARLGAREL